MVIMDAACFGRLVARALDSSVIVDGTLSIAHLSTGKQMPKL
jgi:hypothetical protein